MFRLSRVKVSEERRGEEDGKRGQIAVSPERGRSTGLRSSQVRSRDSTAPRFPLVSST